MEAVQEILILSVAISLAISVLYRVLTKPGQIRQIKEQAKANREKMKHIKDPEEKNKLLAESMKLSQQQMRGNLKPMLVSLIVFFLFLGFLREGYPSFSLHLPVTLPLLSYSYPFIALRSTIGWFWWYILITVPCTFLFRKLLGVE